MNQTLLSKLKALNPTEGEWRIDDWYDIKLDEDHYVSASWATKDDRTLITLAPAMRQELLKMEEERTYVRGMLRQLSALNEDHEYFKCIAGLIQQSREYLRNTNPTQP
jgi:hypothetical protein